MPYFPTPYDRVIGDREGCVPWLVDDRTTGRPCEEPTPCRIGLYVPRLPDRVPGEPWLVYRLEPGRPEL